MRTIARSTCCAPLEWPPASHEGPAPAAALALCPGGRRPADPGLCALRLVAAGAGGHGPVWAADPRPGTEPRSLAQLPLWRGPVRQRQLLGLCQHSRLRPGPGGPGGIADPGVLSGAGAVLCPAGPDPRPLAERPPGRRGGRAGAGLGAAGLAAQLAADGLSLAVSGLCLHRYPPGGLGPGGRHLAGEPDRSMDWPEPGAVAAAAPRVAGSAGGGPALARTRAAGPGQLDGGRGRTPAGGPRARQDPPVSQL